ncbi:MAG TPA: gliding motility-associated protein GldE [Flavisolibacter sp.]|jgi:putative hemolysin|nr:gliding motility-associated protein GldE [Flavisolibacter sp.]
MDPSVTNFLYTQANIFLAVNPQSTVFLVVFLFILLLLSFITSGAEVALFSLQSKDINVLKTKQHAAARRITSLLEERKAVYTSLLIAGGVFNISIIILANFLLSSVLRFGTVNVFIPLDIDMLIKIVAIAFILVFIGKMLPKVWAAQNTLRFAYNVSSVVEALHLLLRRISLRMVAIADQISETSGANESEATSMRELDDAIEVNNEATSIEEKNILKGIVKFSNIAVKQIMKFRLDVNGIDYGTSFEELIKSVEELHYSRLPVYNGSLDDTVGVLNTKDLLQHIDERNFDWHALIRPTLFVPESKLISDLLKEFQTKRIHFAIVVDEFGGASGIVTMEDILEEIIGDIRDEFDEEESAVRKVDDKTYIADAKIMLYDLCRAMRLPIDTFDQVKGESGSLGGLVLELAGEFPSVNETVNTGDFDFTVLEIEKNRIKSVKIFINYQENES